MLMDRWERWYYELGGEQAVDDIAALGLPPAEEAALIWEAYLDATYISKDGDPL